MIRRLSLQHMRKILLIALALLLVMIVIADTQAPTWSNPTVNNSNPKLNDTIQFNVTFFDNVSLSSYIFGWNATEGGFSNLSPVFFTTNDSIHREICLDEYANNTVCSTTNSTYRFEDSCVWGGGGKPSLTDGSYSIGGISFDIYCTNELHINYSVGSNDINHSWSVSDTLSNANISIPAYGCEKSAGQFIETKVRVTNNVGGPNYKDSILYYCHNSSDWILALVHQSNDDIYFNEEAMFSEKRSLNQTNPLPIHNLNYTKNISEFSWI